MRLGYLWAIIEPLLHVTAYALLFGYVLKRHNPLGGNLILFMVTGVIPYLLYSRLAGYISSSVQDNRVLLNLPPVKPLDFVVSRAVLETSKHVVVGFFVFLGLVVGVTSDAIPQHPLELAEAVIGIAAFAVGVGMINIVIRLFIHNWMVIFGIINTPMFLLSGIWFLPAQIPMPYREYLLYNPLMHYIMWFRSGVYRSLNPVDLDRGYALGWSFGVVVLGLTVLRVFRRKVLEPA
jgi:capsular polysaccharide transport system permease protein